MTSIQFVTDPLTLSYEELTNPGADYLLAKGWETWNQYLFYSNKFVIKAYHLENSSSTNLFIINKDAVLQEINKSRESFNKKFSSSLSSKEILDLLISNEECLDSILHENQTLTGILLGFGSANSVAFAKSSELLDLLKNKLAPPFKMNEELFSVNPICKNFLKTYFDHQRLIGVQKESPYQTDKDLSVILKEFNILFEKHSFFQLQECSDEIDLILDPGFAQFDDPYHESLTQKFSNTKRELSDLYKSSSYFETTLKKWME